MTVPFLEAEAVDFIVAFHIAETQSHSFAFIDKVPLASIDLASSPRLTQDNSKEDWLLVPFPPDWYASP